MKYNIIVLIILTASCLLISCISNKISTPEQALSAYIEAYKNGNCNVLYDLNLNLNKTIQSRESYCEQFSSSRSPVLKWIVSKMTYKIENIENNGDTTKIKFITKRPDLSSTPQIWDKLIPENESEAKSIIQELERLYNQNMIKNVETNLQYDLVETDKGWKISNFHTRSI